MAHRKLSDGLQKIAVEELNEDPFRIEECLLLIREWLQKQPHLKVRSDDQSLLMFLRGCKWSIQRTKEKIDYFYTVRTLLPEFFLDRDPFSDHIQMFLKRGVIYPLARPIGIDGPRIIFCDYAAIDFDNMPLIVLVKVLMMSIDLLLQEDDNLVISGVVILVNGTQIPLSYLMQFTLTLMKKSILCVQQMYPLRIKNVIMVNANPAFVKVYDTMCKPFFNEKINNRINMYTEKDFEKVYKHISKPLLPQELGGNNGSCQDKAAKWRTKVESCKEWFLEDTKYKSDEQLRMGKAKTYNEEFNMEGTFRTLIID